MKILKNERIESKSNESHAATILYDNGHRYLAWFGGDQEGNYCDIYVKYDDASPSIVAIPKKYNMRTNSCWNPILFKMNEKVMLAWKEGKFCDSWQTYMAVVNIKEDDTVELGMPLKIPAGFNFAVKTKPLYDEDWIICGSSVETDDSWTGFVELYRISEERFMITGRSNPIISSHPIKGLIQPAIWKQDDKYHMFLRSSSESNHLFYARSKEDHPLVWETAIPTKIDNPNSSVDVVHHSNGKLYLICNDSIAQRDPLSVYEIEVDNGEVAVKDEVYLELDFDEVRDVHPTARTRELSYPYAIEDPDGNIQVAYTFCRKEIRIMTVEV
jgi:predicted neuraminidase